MPEIIPNSSPDHASGGPSRARFSSPLYKAVLTEARSRVQELSAEFARMPLGARQALLHNPFSAKNAAALRRLAERLEQRLESPGDSLRDVEIALALVLSTPKNLPASQRTSSSPQADRKLEATRLTAAAECGMRAHYHLSNLLLTNLQELWSVSPERIWRTVQTTVLKCAGADSLDRAPYEVLRTARLAGLKLLSRMEWVKRHCPELGLPLPGEVSTQLEIGALKVPAVRVKGETVRKLCPGGDFKEDGWIEITPLGFVLYMKCEEYENYFDPYSLGRAFFSGAYAHKAAAVSLPQTATAENHSEILKIREHELRHLIFGTFTTAVPAALDPLSELTRVSCLTQTGLINAREQQRLHAAFAVHNSHRSLNALRTEATAYRSNFEELTPSRFCLDVPDQFIWAVRQELWRRSDLSLSDRQMLYEMHHAALRDALKNIQLVGALRLTAADRFLAPPQLRQLAPSVPPTASRHTSAAARNQKPAEAHSSLSAHRGAGAAALTNPFLSGKLGSAARWLDTALLRGVLTGRLQRRSRQHEDLRRVIEETSTCIAADHKHAVFLGATDLYRRKRLLNHFGLTAEQAQHLVHSTAQLLARRLNFVSGCLDLIDRLRPNNSASSWQLSRAQEEAVKAFIHWHVAEMDEIRQNDPSFYNSTLCRGWPSLARIGDRHTLGYISRNAALHGNLYESARQLGAWLTTCASEIVHPGLILPTLGVLRHLNPGRIFYFNDSAVAMNMALELSLENISFSMDEVGEIRSAVDEIHTKISEVVRQKHIPAPPVSEHTLAHFECLLMNLDKVLTDLELGPAPYFARHVMVHKQLVPWLMNPLNLSRSDVPKSAVHQGITLMPTAGWIWLRPYWDLIREHHLHRLTEPTDLPALKELFLKCPAGEYSAAVLQQLEVVIPKVGAVPVLDAAQQLLDHELARFMRSPPSKGAKEHHDALVKVQELVVQRRRALGVTARAP